MNAIFKHNLSPIAIVALSATSRTAIKDKLKDFFQSIETTFESIQAAGRAAINSFSTSDPCRLTILVEPETDLVALEEKIRHHLDNTPSIMWSEKYVFFAENEKRGKIGFVFPGQGSQYVRMGADLVSFIPASEKILKHADNAFDQESKLSTAIFPPPAEDKAELIDQENRLRQTNVAQPAIGAISLVMLNALARFSVYPEAVCGHSYGELTALYAGGRFSQADFFQLSVARGRYMAEAGKQRGDAGSMMAVKAPIDEIPKLIADNNLDIILANRNSPDQGVLSGPTPEIEKMQAILKENHVRAIQLPVAAAFHSRLVESAARPFQASIQSIAFLNADTPVYSNTSGRPYPADPDAAKQLLGSHLMNPVNFIDNIEQMYADGVDVFIEVGPKTVLTGLIRAILKDRDHTAIAVDASSGKRSGVRDLGAVLCKLSAIGYPVNLSSWF